MDKIALSLISNKSNEINEFLSTYYTKDMNISKKTFKWTCIYTSPLDSINLMSTTIDNNEKYNIATILQLNNKPILVNEKNLNEVIALMYAIYY